MIPLSLIKDHIFATSGLIPLNTTYEHSKVIHIWSSYGNSYGAQVVCIWRPEVATNMKIIVRLSWYDVSVKFNYYMKRSMPCCNNSTYVIYLTINLYMHSVCQIIGLYVMHIICTLTDIIPCCLNIWSI